MDLKDKKITVKDSIRTIVKFNYKENFSPKTTEYIIMKVTDNLFPKFNKMKKDFFDVSIYDIILAEYEKVKKGLPDEIRSYVSSYLSREVVPFPEWLDQNQISDQMINNIMNTRSYNMLDLLSKKYDLEIMELVDECRRKNSSKKKEVAVSETYTVNPLISMRENSVRRENVPAKVKHTVKSKKGSKQFLLVLMAALLSIVLTFGTLAAEVTQTLEELKNKRAVDDLDNFNYTRIFIKSTESFKPTSQNVLDFYDKVSDFDNPNYNYLGFYRAYDNVATDRLYIMDSMLHNVKERASEDQKYTDFYNGIVGNSSYLSFAYDRLCEMGCDRVSDSKYLLAIRAYEAIMNKYPGEIPYKKLTSEQQQAINEMMKLYRDYSEQWVIILGADLNNPKSESDGRKM